MKFLLRRHGDGIGDWLLMLQAMKHANVQQPDVELYVDFELTLRGRRATKTLPTFVRQAFHRSDVRFKLATSGSTELVEIPHLVYPRDSSEPYAAGMVAALAEATGLELEYDRTCTPVFLTAPQSAYYVLSTQSKRETAFKAWGLQYAEALGRRVAEELGPVAQIGASDEYVLEGFRHVTRLGQPFDVVAGLMAHARGCVLIENGLAVLANFLGVPHFVAYPSGRGFGRLDGAFVTAQVRPTVDDVFNYLKELPRANDRVSQGQPG